MCCSLYDTCRESPRAATGTTDHRAGKWSSEKLKTIFGGTALRVKEREAGERDQQGCTVLGSLLLHCRPPHPCMVGSILLHSLHPEFHSCTHLCLRTPTLIFICTGNANYFRPRYSSITTNTIHLAFPFNHFSSNLFFMTGITYCTQNKNSAVIVLQALSQFQNNYPNYCCEDSNLRKCSIS